MPDDIWARIDLVDGRLLWAAAAISIAGLVRGFSGFGAAMVFIPLASAIYEPKAAVILLFLADTVATAPMVVPAFRRCAWREVTPLAIGATVSVPLGVYILTVTRPELVRWVIAAAILAAVATLATGWRLRRVPGLTGTLAIGATAGLTGGLASLSGPPIVLFWLGGQSDAPVIRANIIAFFGLTTIVIGISYGLNGLFSMSLLARALVLLPIYALALWAGATGFRIAPSTLYRRAALLICAAATVLALPAWDSLLR
jgi:uncharacterized membrane protein YfcA